MKLLLIQPHIDWCISNNIRPPGVFREAFSQPRNTPFSGEARGLNRGIVIPANPGRPVKTRTTNGGRYFVYLYRFVANDILWSDFKKMKSAVKHTNQFVKNGYQTPPGPSPLLGYFLINLE